MYEIIMMLIIIIGGGLGLGSTIGLVVLFFGTMGYKIFRKIKYGISLFN